MGGITTSEVVANLVLSTYLFDVQLVGGFTPSALGIRTSAGRVFGPSSTALHPQQQQWQHHPSSHDRVFRRCGKREAVVLEATGGEGGNGEDDPIELYKKQMEDFMAAAHEKRLQAMEAVKAEVQRGYEQQITELQAQVCILLRCVHDRPQLC